MDNITIPEELNNEIQEYCKYNDINNINDFIIKLIRQGFTSEKYGSIPFKNSEIKEIIKEVEVIKEVYVTKDDELNNKITSLENKNKELNMLIDKLNNKKDIYGE